MGALIPCDTYGFPMSSDVGVYPFIRIHPELSHIYESNFALSFTAFCLSVTMKHIKELYFCIATHKVRFFSNL